MSKRVLWIVSVVLVLGSGSGVWAQVAVNDLSDASAMIWSDDPFFNENGFTNPTLCMGNRTPPGQRPILYHWWLYERQYRYEVLTDANITVQAVHGAECDVGYRMVPVLKAWDEQTITYDNWVGNGDWRDFLPPLESFGEMHDNCEYHCICGGPYQGFLCPEGPGVGCWIWETGTIPKEVIQNWLDHPGTNHGLGLIHLVGYPMNSCMGTRQAFYWGQGEGPRITFTAVEIPYLAGAAGPMSGSSNEAPCDVVLSWSGGAGSFERDVYFGTDFGSVNNATIGSDPNTVYKGRQTQIVYPTEGSMILEYDTTYYWRIDEVNQFDDTPWPGKVWYFRTSDGKAMTPVPRDGASDVMYPATLSWTPGVVVADTNGHDVYFGNDETAVTNATPSTAGIYRGRQSEPNYVADGLSAGKTYYWRIDEVNEAVPCGDPCITGDVWSLTTFASEKAWGENPGNGTTVPDLREVVLSWSPGDKVASSGGHDLYIGTDPCDVIDANKGDTPGVTYVNRDVTDYDPRPLEFGTTYYWRVDEVNDPCLWKGDLWSFIVPDYIAIEEFSYPDDPNLYLFWDPNQYTYPPCSWAGTGVSCYLSGGTLQYMYDNNGTLAGNDYYSDLHRDFGVSGVDWTVGSASENPAILSLRFQGAITNSADPVYDRMYVGIMDTEGNYGQVDHLDPNAQLNPTWQEWVIRLQDFNDLPGGVDLSKVRHLSLGFGFYCNWASTLGGEGTVYFDDIRLYPRRCVLDYKPTGDLTNDCAVNRADLEVVAGEWLAEDMNLVLSPITEPCSPVVWYKLDDGEDVNVTDWANDYNGVLANDTGWEDSGGYDGGGYIYLDGLGTRLEVPPEAFSDNIADALTISVWINIDRANYPQSGDWRPFMDAFGTTPFTIYLPTPTWTPDFQSGPSIHFRWSVADPCDDLAECYNVTENDFTGRWHHYAFVKDGATDTIGIYHDGTELCFQADPNFTTNVDTIDVGQINVGYITWGQWPGGIDDFRVYDYALSADEIAYIATDGTGSIFLPLVTPADMYSSTPNVIDFRDYAILANNWMVEQLWP